MQADETTYRQRKSSLCATRDLEGDRAMRGRDDIFFRSSMSGMDKVDFWATRNTRSVCAAGYLRQRRFGALASSTRELRDDGQEKRRRFICHEYGFMNFLSTLEMYILLQHAVMPCFERIRS